MSKKVFNQGSATLTIPATESVAVYSRSPFTVYREIGYPNVPSVKTLLSEVAGDTQTVFGAYASGATIIIEAGVDEVLYEVGAAPVVKELYPNPKQGDPVAVDATGAVSAAAIFGGIVTSTTAAAVTGTIPTGAVMDAAAEFAIGDSIDWSVIVTGGTNAFTVAGDTDHTIVGDAVVDAATSGLFRTRKTAANTFVTYRIG